MRKAGIAVGIAAFAFAAAAVARSGAATSSVTVGGVEYRSPIAFRSDGTPDSVCNPAVAPPGCYSIGYTNPANIAYHKPVATSSTLAGYEQFHNAVNLADGRYGNASSWISNNEWWNWAQLGVGLEWVSSGLGGYYTCNPKWFDTVQFGRDRFGGLNDRSPGHFYVFGSNQDVRSSNYVSTQLLYSGDAASYVNYNGILDYSQTVRAKFAPAQYCYVLVQFEKPDGAVDEIEVFAPTPGTTASVFPRTATFGGSVQLVASLQSSTYSNNPGPLSGRTLHFSIDGTEVASAVTDSAGNAVANAVPLGARNAGAHSLTARFFADGTHADSNVATATLQITRAVPVITWTSPAPIDYGTPLSSAQLNASTDVAGAFSYSPPAGTVLSKGTQTLFATFTSADANYGDRTISRSITVNPPPAPTITWADPAPIDYGTLLGASQLNATATIAGSFAYSPGEGTLLPAGAQTLSAAFRPADANYPTVVATRSIVVNPPAGPQVLIGEAAFRAAALRRPTLINFEEQPANAPLPASAYAARGVTIEQLDGFPLYVGQWNYPGDAAMLVPSGVKAISSSWLGAPAPGFVPVCDTATCRLFWNDAASDRIRFTFTAPVSAAGIHLGQNDVSGTRVTWYDTAGAVIEQRNFPGFQPRSDFVGLVNSATPIGSMVVENAANNGDAVYFDDLMFVPIDSDAGSTVAMWGSKDGTRASADSANLVLARNADGTPLRDVIAVSGGVSHTLALHADGTVSAWGDNTFGQLGDGTVVSRATAARVPGLSRIITVAAGWYGSYAVDADGFVWAWGDNGSGTIGDGTTVRRLSPVRLGGISGIVSIAARGQAIAAKRDGTLWTWGLNDSGQIGDGTTAPRLTPYQVPDVSSVIAVAAGNSYDLALTASGDVYAAGSNWLGQLGDGTTQPHGWRRIPSLAKIIDVAAGDSHSVALRNDGAVLAWGWNDAGQVGDGTTIGRLLPAQTSAASGITAISAGGAHTMALDGAGRIWTWGVNGSGQLGVTPGAARLVPDRIVRSDGTYATATAIAAGWLYSLSVGTLTPAAVVSPTALDFGKLRLLQASAPKSVTLTNTGNIDLAYPAIEQTGSPEFSIASESCAGATSIPPAGVCSFGFIFKPSTPGLRTGRFTFRMDASAVVDLAGEGVGDTTPPVTGAVESPAPNSAGWHGLAQLTSQKQVAVTMTPVDEAGGSGVASLTYKQYLPDGQLFTQASGGGSATTLVTKFDVEGTFTYKFFATDNAGNVETERALLVRIDATAPLITVTEPREGAIYRLNSVQPHSFSCADALSGIASCAASIAGANIDTSTPGTKTFTVTALDLAGNVTSRTVTYSVIQDTTTALTVSPGAVVEGRPVGLRAAVATTDGMKVTTGSVRFDDVSVATSPRTLATVSLSQDGSAFIVVPSLTRGTVRVQAVYLADATASASSSPVAAVTVAPRAAGALRAWGSNADGQIGDGTIGGKIVMPFSPLTAGVIAASGGVTHSVAATRDGVWAWGRNDQGQLGIGTASAPIPSPSAVAGLSGVTQLAAGQFHTLALSSAGLYAWGANDQSQLGDGTHDRRPSPVAVNLQGVRAIATGDLHSVALLTDGTVRGWGLNAYGSLGDGTGIERSVPTIVPGLDGVVAIDAAFYNTIALKSDGTVWSWGNNQYGQVGTGGTSFAVLSPVQVQGVSEVVAIAAGYTHRLALEADGTVWAWGTNNAGQLGNGTSTPAYTPIQVPGLNGIVAVAAGIDTSFALAGDGTIWGWGWNVFGQLARPLSEATSQIPVKLPLPSGIADLMPGAYHTIGIGPAARATVSTSTLTFADQARGTQGAAQTVTIGNDGNALLHIRSVSVTFNQSDYVIVADGCSGATLASTAGSLCTIDVAFRPASLGVRNAFLVVTSDAAGSPDQVNLTGTGFDPNQAPVAVALATPDVGEAVDSRGRDVTLSGAGSSDADGTIASYRWLENGVQVAGSVTASVHASIGTHTYELVVTDDDGAEGHATATVVVRDTTPPVISIDAPRATLYAAGSNIAASYACADVASSVLSCAGPVASGAALDTSSPGFKSFRVDARDAAGNVASLSTSYAVAAAACLAPPRAMAGWWAADGDPLGFVGGDGELVGGATFAPGVVGQAFSLNGSSAYVRLVDSGSFAATGGATVLAWIYPAGDRPGTIASDQGHYAIARAADGHLRVAIADANANLQWFETSAVAPRDTWTHVAVSFGATSFSVWLDGRPAGEVTTGLGLPPTVAQHAFWLGAQAETGDAFFDGLIDEAVVFVRVLTDADVEQFYLAAANGMCRPAPAALEITAPRVEYNQPLTLTVRLTRADTGEAIASKSVNVSLGGSLGAPITGQDGTFTITAPLDNRKPGLYPDALVGRFLGDAFFTRASATATLAVFDGTPPVISNVPSAITLEAAASDGAAAAWTAPSAHDEIDGAIAVTCTPASGSTFVLGQTQVRCAAVDASGNRAEAAFDVTVVDTTPPAISGLPANMTIEATGASGAVASWTASTATDAVDGAVAVACNPASGSTFPLGTTTVTCSAVDRAGNGAASTFTVTVADTQPPDILVPPALALTIEATAPSGALVTYTVPATDKVSGSLPTTCSPASGTVFPVGVTTITCSATDAAGNRATVSFSYTVRDTTPPAIAGVPADLLVEATRANGAAGTWSGPTAADIVDGAVTVSCDPVSGSTFALGTTAVTCTAADRAGNISRASFRVTVVDTTPPAIANMPADMTLEATGPVGAPAFWQTPTATDIVDGSVPVTCTPAPLTLFTLNITHTVTCRAADSRGNISTATFRITVRDTTPPVVTVPLSMTVEATGPNGAAATFTAMAADAVNGAPQVTCAPASGSTFPLGTTTVTCSATDASSNTGTATFTVTVRDTTPPTINVPAAASMVFEATGPQGAVVSYSVTAGDIAAGAVATACSPASATVFPLGTTLVHCSASDSFGNRATAVFPVTVRDTTAPAFVTSFSPDVVIRSSPFTFGGIAVSDAVGVTSVTVNGVAATQSSPGGFWSASVPVSLPVPVGGALTFTVVAKDAAGNARTQQVVIDNDGISAAIDRNPVTGADESMTFSNGFVSGTVRGSITNRAGHVIGISPGTFGVTAVASGPGGRAVIQACSGSLKQVWLDQDSERAEIRCDASTGSITVYALDARPTIEVAKLLSETIRTGWLSYRTRQYWQVTSLRSGGVKTGSPLEADPANTEPLVVTLQQIDDAGAPLNVGTLVLDPGESVDVHIVPAATEGEDDRVALVGLAGTVQAMVSGISYDVRQGETKTPFVDHTPPVIASVKASVPVIWAPNDKLVAETISVAVTDNADPAPICKITGVTSNEPPSADGDSRVTGDLTLDVRAARLGAANGRIYTVSVACTDAAKNTSAATTTITVPHDQRK